MERTDDVAVEVVVDADGAAARGRVSVLRLSWRQDDPLAVDIELSAAPDHPALPRGRWVVLRDFLRYGLDEPTGDGHVRLRPEVARDAVRLELLRGVRRLPVRLPRPVVADFLDRTEQHVASGQEAGDAVLDALVARLLDGT